MFTEIVEVEGNADDESCTDEEGTVEIPYVGQTFASWEEAELFLDRYAKKKKFQWTTGSSCSIASANSRLQPGEQKFPESLKHRNVKLTCVSGGPIRINQGRGDRPFQA